MRLVVVLVLALGCKDKDKPVEPGAAEAAKPGPAPKTGVARPTVPPKLDLDGNGQVTDAERIEARKHRLGFTLLKLDTDGDNQVSLGELERSAMPFLTFEDPKAVDADRDGMISVDEIDAAIAARRTQQRARWEKR